jgi:hypothetical protein
MANSSAYHQVLVKFDRAEEHVKEFDSRWNAFRKTNPYAIEPEIDPQTGNVSYRVIEINDVPLCFSAIAGDVFHNLRSALDHLAWNMVEASGSTPNSQTAFPIFNSATEYEAQAPGRVHGMRQLAVEAIDRIRPYKGGNEFLWRLHRLNNIDKHRLLIAIGLGDFGHRMTPSQHEKWLRDHPIEAAAMRNRGLGLVFHPRFPTRALQAGDILLTVPAAEVDENMGFVVDVALNEPEVIEEVFPLYLVFRSLQSEVRIVIDELAIYLPR